MPAANALKITKCGFRCLKITADINHRGRGKGIFMAGRKTKKVKDDLLFPEGEGEAVSDAVPTSLVRPASAKSVHAEQLSTLSREALASASSSSMAVKLKDIISQMNPQGPQSRG